MSEKVDVAIPLGYIKLRDGKLFNVLKEIFRMEVIIFNVGRLTTECVQIKITQTNVPATRDRNICIEDSVSGITGDTLRLSYGEKVTIKKIGSEFVNLTIEK